ncbi:BON domain-containing protein [Dysgonomonas sp. 520]|uniref:BON domain-containing protein n=1 Tax=Dysgonomonas sp. 520 TaxID=2302931 RepID=UPI0013D0F4FB|nr:BON domain-containing protein [Dysgonomonas sp. 520]NDW09453.1 BON domain-containing protein [Dysgonomonas sp. 520]
MRKSVLYSVFAMLMGVVLFSCTPNDKKLQKQIDSVISISEGAVNATVKDGVVTLTGSVNSEEARSATEATVKAMKDVKSVINQISVDKPQPVVEVNPDSTLSSTVTAALSAAGYKDVVVTVKDGEVTLTGNAKKTDLQKIMQIANEAKPKKVNNQLTLK